MDACFFMRAAASRVHRVQNAFGADYFYERPCLAEGLQGFQGCVRDALPHCTGGTDAEWAVPGYATGAEACRGAGAAALCLPYVYARPCTTPYVPVEGLLRWDAMEGWPLFAADSTELWGEIPGGPSSGGQDRLTYTCGAEGALALPPGGVNGGSKSGCVELADSLETAEGAPDLASADGGTLGLLRKERSLVTVGREGDGWCDNDLNSIENHHDGGDCCASTCAANPTRPHTCGSGGALRCLLD
jgi:hypothetical protein